MWGGGGGAWWVVLAHGLYIFMCGQLNKDMLKTVFIAPNAPTSISSLVALVIERLPVISDLDHFGPGDFGRL